MPKNQKDDALFDRLRRKAEIILSLSPDVQKQSQKEMVELIHELNVHQIELDIQNEELKQSQQEISALHQEYQDLYEFAPCAYITLDSNMIISRCNLTAVTLLGKDKTKLIGRGLYGFIATESLNDYYDTLKKSDRSDEKKSIELLINRNNDESRWVNADIQADHDKTGTLYQWRLLFTDITDRVNLENQLLQTHKMESLGRLAGGIAHDFNNLLYPIIGFAEMLKQDLPQDSPEHESAQEIFNAGKRCGELVKQILAFSRQAHHELKPVLVQEILKEVLNLTRSSTPTDIEINHDISDCGSVMAEPTQIYQIGMNLITNAYHAVEKAGGIISVQFKEIMLDAGELEGFPLQSGGYAWLSVADNGVGISPNAIGNVFDPYFTTKEQGKGTGLGLALVYGIVKGYNGDIKISSKVGKGTTLNVYLPLIKNPVETIANDRKLVLLTGTESLLVVDDKEPVVRLEKQMLERLGYKVSGLSSSLEALEIFKANPDAYDLVVTDMTMPNMTGDKLTKEILSIRSDIPVIICTGFSERINKEQAEAIGVKGFLMKPIVKYEIARMVRKLLDEAKAFQQSLS